MSKVPPDPRNRVAFEYFWDSNPAHRMTRDEISAELSHWAAWLAENNAVGKRPAPGRGLQIATTVFATSGGVFTLVGVLGWVSGTLGDIATTGGIFSLVGAMFSASRSEEAVRDDNDANVLVGLRLDELLHQVNSPGN